MKKILVFLLLIGISCGLSAQMITVSVPTITANPGETVNVPVTLVSGAGSSGTPIGACDLNINYDDDVLTYIGLTNFYANMPAGEWIYSGNLSMVAANWIDGALSTEAVPDGTVLFVMQFTYNGGNSDLAFSKYEFYDADYLLVPTTPVNGAVNQNAIAFDVTFRVDLSHESVSPNGVHLAGSFNIWDCSANPMTNDGNGLYSTTIPLEENSVFTYRYVNGNDASGLENVPAECGVLNGTGEYDREFSLGSAPFILDTVCFSRCENCPTLHEVTFRVDMINQSVSVDGMHLAGSFNNWSYNSTPMTLVGAGAVYEVTLALDESEYYEFKFINGNTAQDAEIVPAGCSNNGNRYFTVPATNLILDAYCFGECVECGNLPEFFDITFEVDMTNETISPDGIHIAGSFQGWQPGTTPMVNQGGNLFTYTVTLLEGSSIEYRYVNGNTSAGYETLPGECSVNGNRYFNSVSADTLLPEVCFASCDTCQIPEVMVTFGVDMSGNGVVISPDGIHLAGSFQGWDPASTPMNAGNFSNYTVTLPLQVGSVQQFRFVNGNTAAGYEIVPFECADGDNRFFTVPAADTAMTMVCFGSCDPCPQSVIYENSDLPVLIIYPNPSSGDSRLKLRSHESGAVTVRIYNVQGNIVFRNDVLHFSPGSYEIPLETATLQPGIYMVVVLNEMSGITVKQKFVRTN
ncbi:MAG: Alpha-amylase [Bacteroidetes bacterium]|nr:MAG: Alpha-amylase [Bacteroidota bacterium]